MAQRVTTGVHVFADRCGRGWLIVDYDADTGLDRYMTGTGKWADTFEGDFFTSSEGAMKFLDQVNKKAAKQAKKAHSKIEAAAAIAQLKKDLNEHKPEQQTLL